MEAACLLPARGRRRSANDELDPRARAAAARTRPEREPRTMQRRDVADDRESEPGSGPGPAGDPMEPLHDARPFLRRDAGPVVLDLEVRATLQDAAAQRHHATARRVLEGVVDQVVEQFAQQPL